MKKSLVALAALAVAGVASAQSSVTLFGIVDAGVSYYSNKAEGGGKTSSWQQSNSGYNSSRIGFRGTEDLGGGLAAGFWLEAAVGNDTGAAGGGGTQLFNRRSTVSLSGPFGEFRIGRDYTATFWNDTTFDPFGTNGVGTNIISRQSDSIGNTQYVRSSNSLGYFLPANLGGFYGQVQYGFHEQVKTTGTEQEKNGQYAGARFGYANGPLDVALAYGQSKIADDGIGNSNDAKTLNLGASYDFGAVKLFGELSQVKNEFGVTGLADTNTKYDGALIGLSAPVGAGLIRAAYSTVRAKTSLIGDEDAKSSKLAIGYVHNLSKRTALYATYAHIWNRNDATLTTSGPTSSIATVTPGLNGKSSANGYDFGIRHAF